MFESGSLFGSLIFGSIGAGYFIYGKNQQHFVALAAGGAMCVIPYVAPNPTAMIPLCIILMALPFLLTSE
jgi:hypothetical protein